MNRVRIGPKAASDTATDYSDRSVDWETRLSNIRIRVAPKPKAKNQVNYEGFENITAFDLENALVFDLVGVEAPIANAFRRILISEIPTMAIEKVTIYQNTSTLVDEVLAHRLGLIPIQADPRLFKFRADGEMANEENTLAFTLAVECSVKENAPEIGPPSAKYRNAEVYTKDLTWIPQKDQEQRFGPNGIRPVHPDILVAKLRPGQCIEAELFCEKGIGLTHAKWSPVATASYRLLPEIVLKQEVPENKQQELVKLCPAHVFDIEDIAGSKKKRVVAARPRNCTMCRECIRTPEWENYVQLQRVRDHFIFSIESTGIYTPQDLFRESLKVLKNKCDVLLQDLLKISSSSS